MDCSLVKKQHTQIIWWKQMLNEPDVLLLLFLPFIYLFYTVELRRFLTDNQDLSYCTGNSILKNQPTVQVFWQIYHKAWMINNRRNATSVYSLYFNNWNNFFIERFFSSSFKWNKAEIKIIIRRWSIIIALFFSVTSFSYFQYLPTE